MKLNLLAQLTRSGVRSHLHEATGRAADRVSPVSAKSLAAQTPPRYPPAVTNGLERWYLSVHPMICYIKQFHVRGILSRF